MITTFTIRNVANEDGAAQISDFGAHVLSWTPAGGHPAVWQPKAVYLGKPIRGGVPVVLPWFALGFEHGEIAGKKPKHGFARTTVWHVDEDATDDRRIRYTLSDADATPELLAQLHSGASPRFHAVYDIEVGKELTMTLTVTNDGTEPLRYETALHTHFHVGDLTQVSLHGLEGSDYLDATVAGYPPRVQPDEPVTFDGPTRCVWMTRHGIASSSSRPMARSRPSHGTREPRPTPKSATCSPANGAIS